MNFKKGQLKEYKQSLRLLVAFRSQSKLGTLGSSYKDYRYHKANIARIKSKLK